MPNKPTNVPNAELAHAPASTGGVPKKKTSNCPNSSDADKVPLPETPANQSYTRQQINKQKRSS